jgi:hypothetical protein
LLSNSTCSRYTTYLDQRVRLGKGSRGSVFVFTRKSAEQGERDRKRWSVGGLAVGLLYKPNSVSCPIACKRPVACKRLVSFNPCN